MDPADARRSSVAQNVWAVLWSGLLLACAVALVWRLRTIVVWLLLATMVALALDPAVQVLSRRGLRRGWAVAIVALACAAGAALFGATLVPMLVKQGRELIARAPDLLERIESSMPLTWARDELGPYALVRRQARWC